jgi:hypothetical protein
MWIWDTMAGMIVGVILVVATIAAAGSLEGDR